MTKLIKLTPKLAIDLDSPQVKADGVRAWVTGESGSGKSNAIMLLLSQWVAAGRQTVVLDAHGEYGDLWTLSLDRIERIGYGDRPVGAESVSWVMAMVEAGKSVLLDLKEWTDIEQDLLVKFTSDLMTELYTHQRRHPSQLLVVVEEAQTFIPQAVSDKAQFQLVKFFNSMLTGGRKYGLNFVLGSQRQSLVDSNAISQCNLRVFMRVSELKDWQSIRKQLPDKYPLKFRSKDKRDIALFQSGEAVVVSRWFDEVSRVQLLLPDVAVHRFLEE